jgi:sensor histidine kinase YesM
MSRNQRIISYIVVLFMMIWGLDLINAVKYNQPITWKQALSPFHISQVIYALITFLLCRQVWKKILPQRRYGWILPGVLGLILAFVLTRYMLEEWLASLLFQARNYRPNVSWIYYLLDNIYYALIYITLGTLLYLLDAQLMQQKRQQELLQKNREAELQFLRSQIHPHFLFNTLNNIYSLVYRQAKEAPQAMLQLSELMRYMLYEKNEMVELEKEWTHCENFISLQQLRFPYPVQVHLKQEGNWKEWQIPPYLLIPFVENAFKHGDFQQQPLAIHMAGDNEKFCFEISNAIGRQQKDSAGGIGIENLRRRLQLLFPGTHQLKIDIGDNTYSAKLEIRTGESQFPKHSHQNS